MADYETIVYEKSVDDKIAHIALNRPDTLNALSDRLLDEVIEALQDADHDDNVKAIVIKGAGRCFSAGHDLSEWGAQYGMKPGVRPPQRPRALADRDYIWRRYTRLLYTLKPKIAQVHGYCLEGGVNLTMLCDITIAGRSARFGFPGQRMGDAGLTILPMLFNLVGYKRARELLLTGVQISAEKAEEIGLINRCVADEDLDRVATNMAKAIALMPVDGIVVGAAYTHEIYDRLGFTAGIMHFAYGHAWWSNLKLEEGDFNLLKRRSEVGLAKAFDERDARYNGLLEADLGGVRGSFNRPGEIT